MVNQNKYVFEEDGYFYVTDKYDLRRIRFISDKERKRWLDISPYIIGKPDVARNLAEGLDVVEEDIEEIRTAIQRRKSDGRE